MHRLIAPADYRRMPWKNGSGRTTEIAAGPPDAALDAFDWRVSIADVDVAGPFSRFPGVERTIVLIAGNGMRLAFGERRVELRTPFDPYTFDGADDVDCTLLAGRVRDFNLMVRRGRARGVVSAVRDGVGARVGAASMRIVYAHGGPVRVRLRDDEPITVATGHALIVSADDVDDSNIVVDAPRARDGVALVVSIDTPR